MQQNLERIDVCYKEGGDGDDDDVFEVGLWEMSVWGLLSNNITWQVSPRQEESVSSLSLQRYHTGHSLSPH